MNIGAQPIVPIQQVGCLKGKLLGDANSGHLALARPDFLAPVHALHQMAQKLARG